DFPSHAPPRMHARDACMAPASTGCVRASRLPEDRAPLLGYLQQVSPRPTGAAMSIVRKRMSRPPARRSAPPAHLRRKRVLPPAPKDPASKAVTATIEAVVFANDAGDFVILRGRDERDERVTLKGALAHVHVGETVECSGDWREHSEHG